MSCFNKWDNTVKPAPAYHVCGPVPAGGNVQCCSFGHECLSSGFCHYGSSSGSDDGGYYIGGCSDENFSDPSCQSPCGAYKITDAVYNFYGDGMWTCCDQDPSNGGPSCGNPLGRNFTAPPQHQLFGVATLVGTNDGLPYPTDIIISASMSADAALSASGLTQSLATTNAESATASVAPISNNAPNIQVLVVASTSAPMSTFTSTLTPTPMSTLTSVSAPTPVSTDIHMPTASSQPAAMNSPSELGGASAGSGPMSLGAIAGITVGVVTFLVMVGGILFYLIRRNQALKRRVDGLEKVTQELELSKGDGYDYPPSELCSDTYRVELPTPFHISELPHSPG